MRDIKFRAWDKVSRIWLDTDEYVIYPDDGVVAEIEETNTLELVDEIEETNTLELVDINHEAVLEQYTGLKDKNGVEIYEGDIVAEVPQFDDDEPDLYVVAYNETGDYPAFDLKGWTGEVNGISELSLTCGIEVIGNIHENPDLLEEI